MFLSKLKYFIKLIYALTISRGEKSQYDILRSCRVVLYVMFDKEWQHFQCDEQKVADFEKSSSEGVSSCMN